MDAGLWLSIEPEEVGMGTSYDAIVVGARCAGSPTAMLLARRGYRVLLVDRSTFPSDTLSTLLIHAPGMAALARWGVLDEVASSGCPPIERYSFDFGPLVLAGSPWPTDDGVATGYAPRRSILDTVLVEAAARAGAEVRQGFSVDELVIEDGVVVGIRGRERDGRSVTERAGVVVGADGRNSFVAKAVGAERYREKPRLQWGYYSFWSGLPTEGAEFVIRPHRGWGAFPTNDGLTLVVVGWPAAEADTFKADIEGSVAATFALAPEFAERVHRARRVERFAGGGVAGFLRRPYGPGWVLVGDAGYMKDPITAQGISDAYRHAELCAGALDRSFSEERPFEAAMAEYQRTRDAGALPMYEFTSQLATLEPPPPEMQQLFGAIAGNPDAMESFVSVVAGTVSPVEFFDPDNIGRLMGLRAPSAAG